MTTPECPFSFDVPEDIITREVPEHLREALARLMPEREAYRLVQPCDVWYRRSMEIFDALESIERELRSAAGVGGSTCVEYFKDWRYRCLDQQTLRAEYIARGGKIAETAEEKVGKPVPGRTWQEAEAGHLCLTVIRARTNCPHFLHKSATLEDALNATRKKKRKRPIA